MPHRNLTLLALLVGASVPGFGGDRAVSTKPVGTMIGTGPVWRDGSPASEFSAPPGAALFGGDVIQTGKAGSAVVRLLSGTSATVAEKSTVVLDVNSGVTARPGASAALDLREGVLTVLSAGRQPTEVILRPPVFDGHIAALDEAALAQALANAAAWLAPVPSGVPG